MTLGEFQSLVSANAACFAGVHPETTGSLTEAERRLDVTLPASLKWLLSEYGYSAACGVPNLAESVDTTLRCRAAIGLPTQFVILDDRGDAGVVLLDTASPAGRVIWVGAHEVPRLAGAEAVEDTDEFPDYSAWVVRCLEDAEDAD